MVNDCEFYVSLEMLFEGQHKNGHHNGLMRYASVRKEEALKMVKYTKFQRKGSCFHHTFHVFIYGLDYRLGLC